MRIGFLFDLLVLGFVLFLVLRWVAQSFGTAAKKAQRQIKPIQSAPTQEWVYTGTEFVPTQEESTPREVDVDLVATGRTMNALRRRKVLRCEEMKKGDERFTRVTQVNHRGIPCHRPSVFAGSLEEVAARIV